MTSLDEAQRQDQRPWLPLIWLALGFAAALRMLYATATFGLGVSGDSLQYMSAALDIAAGETVKGWDGGMYVSWPPLYPALLAAMYGLGAGLLESARWLNAIALGCTVFLVGAYGLRHVTSPAVRALGTAIVCSSVALFENAVMMWSEPIFLLLLIAWFATLLTYLERRSKAALVLAAVLAGTASMQRYPGVTLIGVSGLAILYPMAGTKFGWRVLQSAVFGIIAASPLALWLKRNKDLEGIATSWAGGETRPIPENLAGAFDVAFTWLIPSSPIYRLAAILIIGIVGPLVGYALLRAGIEKRVRLPLALHAFFAIVYVAFLCYSGARYSIELINQRYLSPVFISLVVIAVTFMDIAVGYWRNRTVFSVKGNTLATAVIVLSTAWLYYPYASIGILSDRYRRDGIFGFTQAAYVQSPFINHVRDRIPQNSDVYANNAEVLFVNAGITEVRPFENGDGFRDAIAKRADRGRPVYLVWFDSAIGGPTYPDLADLPAPDETLPNTTGGVIQCWKAESP